MKNLDQSINNSEILDASFYSIKNDKYSNIDGGDGNEDSTEYEGEESEVSVPVGYLPRFIQLVKLKKQELKSKYGLGHFENKSTMERECKTIQVPQTYIEKECKNVPYLCPTFTNPFKSCTKQVCVDIPKVRMVSQEVCVNVPKVKVIWVSGWRKKWLEFKLQSGLSKLKDMALGLVSVPSSLDPNNTIPQVNNDVPTTNTSTSVQNRRPLKGGVASLKNKISDLSAIKEVKSINPKNENSEVDNLEIGKDLGLSKSNSEKYISGEFPVKTVAIVLVVLGLTFGILKYKKVI